MFKLLIIFFAQLDIFIHLQLLIYRKLFDIFLIDKCQLVVKLQLRNYGFV